MEPGVRLAHDLQPGEPYLLESRRYAVIAGDPFELIVVLRAAGGIRQEGPVDPDAGDLEALVRANGEGAIRSPLHGDLPGGLDAAPEVGRRGDDELRSGNRCVYLEGSGIRPSGTLQSPLVRRDAGEEPLLLHLRQGTPLQFPLQLRAVHADIDGGTSRHDGAGLSRTAIVGQWLNFCVPGRDVFRGGPRIVEVPLDDAVAYEEPPDPFVITDLPALVLPEDAVQDKGLDPLFRVEGAALRALVPQKGTVRQNGRRPGEGGHPVFRIRSAAPWGFVSEEGAVRERRGPDGLEEAAAAA